MADDQGGSDETKSKPIEESKVNKNLLSTSKADSRENLQEDQRRRDEKSSRSIEETKGRNLDFWSTNSGRRSDERREIDSRSRGEKKDKEGQIRDNRDSYNTDTRENQQQQRQRDIEMQRRRYETESRIWREERDDWRGSESRLRCDERVSDWGENKSDGRDYESQRTPRSETEWRDHERTLPDYRRNETEWRYDEITGRRYELQPYGSYRIHAGKHDCYSYFRTGTCLNGRSNCKFNHPTTLPLELPKRTTPVPVCKYFLRGYCNRGSDCGYPHAMPQGRYMDEISSDSEWEFDERSMDRRVSDSESRFDDRNERIYQTESIYRPEKRSRTIPDSRLRNPRGTFEEPESEQERREIPENPFMAAQRARERREAQENAQGQTTGGRIINLSHLINPIAKKILQERKRKIEIERLSREESPIRSSQQSNSID